MRYENELFCRWTWEARRPNDLARNPHESLRESKEEFGDRATRGESGSGRMGDCAGYVSMGGSEKTTTINGQKRLIDFFNHPSTQHPRHRPFLGVSARPPLPELSSCYVETQLYRSAQTGRLEDITSRPSRQSIVRFKLLGGRLRKSMGIRA